MAGDECTNEQVGRDGADALLVRDVMVRAPKTLPAGCTVGDVRRLFDNGHVRTALLADGERFTGAIQRDDLPAEAAEDAPAGPLARRDVPSIEPDAPVPAALERMDADGTRRLVVLDAAGSLRGLLCLTRDRAGFCQS